MLYFYSLRVGAPLDHFGYPPPPLDQWQQHTWYDLGAAQELLHSMRNRLARGLPASASPPGVKTSSTLFQPATAQIRPRHGGKFVKASMGEGPTPSAVAVRASSSTTTTSPKTEMKKKKKRKAAKCTVTSETVNPPEKKKKLISESPDSEAEGPFRDSDHTECAPEGSPHNP